MARRRRARAQAQRQAQPQREMTELETAQLLFASSRLIPREVRTSVLSVIQDELATRLSALTALQADRLLQTTGVLAAVHGADDEPEVYRASSLRLLLVVLDSGSNASREAAAIALRRLDPARAEHELRARWQRCALASPIDRWSEWARLTMPGDAPEALFEELLSHDGAMTEPGLLARTIHRLPPRFQLPLLRLHNRRDVFARPLADCVVAATNGRDALLALLDDPHISRAHAPASRRLVAGGVVFAEAVLARATSSAVPDDALVAALELLPVQDVERRVVASPSKLYPALLASSLLLRARDWFALARTLPEKGRELLVAIARDSGHPERSRAIAELARSATTAADRIEKRQYLFALGQTRHPDATLPLLAALDDPDLADTGPLVCTALGACGDTRALPELEQRTHGRHAGFIRAAIAHIRHRTAEIHRGALVAAAKDTDPAIRDLATRAAAGDEDAAIVLEDALREMGRL